MSEAREKVQLIFREMAGDLAQRLSGSQYLADLHARITAALAAADDSKAEVLRKADIAFHVSDWQAEAAFVVALALFPDRFTDEEIQDGVESLLLHAPAHLLEAARLAGHSTENVFFGTNPEIESNSKQTAAADDSGAADSPPSLNS